MNKFTKEKKYRERESLMATDRRKVIGKIVVRFLILEGLFLANIVAMFFLCSWAANPPLTPLRAIAICAALGIFLIPAIVDLVINLRKMEAPPIVWFERNYKV